MNENPEIFDYVVSGGGFVGLTVLSALANQSLRTALIEPQKLLFNPNQTAAAASSNPALLPNMPSILDARTTALSAQTVDFLAKNGVVLPTMTAMTRIQVSEQGSLGSSMLGDGKTALGFTIANKDLGSALWARAQQNQNLQCFFSEKIEQIENLPEFLVITLASGKIIQTKILLVAEGNESQTREKLGFTMNVRDYESTAMVTNIEVSHPKAGMAFERFTATGPMAMLPLGGAHYALIQTLPTHLAETMQKLSDAAFREQAADAFGPKLGVWRANGKRQYWQLTQQLSPYLVRDRTILLGNAAHTLHPVAGQGFNLGVRDVMDFVDLFIENYFAANQSNQINIWELLQQYQTKRQIDHQKTANFTDNLIRTFGLKNTLIKHSRSMGFIALDLLPYLKNVTIQTGSSGR